MIARASNVAKVRATNVLLPIAFNVRKDRWSMSGPNNSPLRELFDVELFEASVVTNPAYPQTTIAVVPPTLRMKDLTLLNRGLPPVPAPRRNAAEKARLVKLDLDLKRAQIRELELAGTK